MTEEEVVQLIAREVVARIREARPQDPRVLDPLKMVPVNISARHLHLSPAHVDALFGPAGLTVLRPLMQPGQFAANETAAVIGPKGSFAKVRVLGPARGDTQLELSLTDARALGLDVPVRLSGNITGTPGITLETARGRVAVPQGIIVAARHVHLDPATAARFGVQQGQQVKVRTTGIRPLIFDGVVVRVSDKFVPEFHVDTDEGNAGAIRDGDLVEILD